MIIPMTITARPQQRYDHRLRNLVHRTGDVTIATDLGVPRGTARGWLSRAPEVVVSLDVTHLSELELQQEILTLRRRVQKLAALLQLVLAVLRVSGFTSHAIPSIAFIAQVYWGTKPVVSAYDLGVKATDQQRPEQAPSGDRLSKARAPAPAWCAVAPTP